MPDEPDAFPIEWEDPTHARQAWQHDPIHSPNAVKPLSFELASKPFVAGFGWMAQDPILVNNYIYYQAAAPPAPPGPETALPPGTFDRLREGGRRWREEIIPEVQGHIDFYRNTDFDAMSDAALADEVARLPELRHRSGRLHTQVTTPAYIAMTLLSKTYAELTGGSELEALRLVQGYGSKSIEAGEALWKVSELVKSLPAVNDYLLEAEPEADVCKDLDSVPDAVPFLEAFDAYLDEFGWRSGGEFSSPTWAEAHETPLAMLRTYLETNDYDPAAEQRLLIEERAAATKEVMSQLEPEARVRLEDVLDAARSVSRLMEDHNYYIDQRLYTLPRRMVLAAGRRLAAGNELENETHVWFLYPDEVVDALGGHRSSIRETSIARERDFKRWREVTPPRNIGAPPPEGADQDIPRPQAEMRGNELRGNGSSEGVARGAVRIVPALTDAGRLRPGDVLVTVATLPPWTPLFAVASAVVTETGGILSHTAITAREYKLPAVLAVAGATRLLKDGQLVEVDGTAGTVRIVG